MHLAGASVRNEIRVFLLNCRLFAGSFYIIILGRIVPGLQLEKLHLTNGFAAHTTNLFPLINFLSLQSAKSTDLLFDHPTPQMSMLTNLTKNSLSMLTTNYTLIGR